MCPGEEINFYISRSLRKFATESCNEFGLSAQGLKQPARTFVRPVPRAPDGLTIRAFQAKKQQDE